ncbi:hypothetical protein [Tepidibacter formicigenes]|jgi:RNA polymerase subunit RPABC4/transcription elongation factor Spt4|uniref:Double zinc ribbon n=1 Tax=Tepidibacter formicigenes DSM 15518 TaxID=1123349 RepID=A0A1M6PYX0_9FIRM|nr:hypothetical protein [Tepidibacter formicigenes]SHK13101.1 hypothetical protein SAMN02744037_01693 [Tepidibacter formicigenes DSM 15518]
MIKCPKCNKQISARPGTVCPRCKRKITQNDIGYMFCPEPECKAILPKSAVYCPKCGAKIRNESVNEKINKIVKKIEKILNSL